MTNVQATLQYRYNGWDLVIDNNLVEFESMEPTTPETTLLNDLVDYSYGYADEDGEVDTDAINWAHVRKLITERLGDDVVIVFDVGSDS